MKRFSRSALILSLLLLLVLDCAVAFGQGTDLKLTTEVVGQRYCALGTGVDALQLRLRLRYTNEGRQKLILYKGNRLFYQIFISRDAAEASARRLELRATHARYFDERPEKIDSSAPGAVFVVLSPGAAYETKQTISIAVAREGEGRPNLSIGAGAHVLYIAASTWYESNRLAEQLRERWRARGHLWSEPLWSNSVQLVVEKERKANACQ